MNSATIAPANFYLRCLPPFLALAFQATFRCCIIGHIKRAVNRAIVVPPFTALLISGILCILLRRGQMPFTKTVIDCR
jgi:hypothetical protein